MPRSHVTKREAQAVVDFACDLAAYISLPPYRFSLHVDPCEEGATASISTVDHRWIAEIHVAESWMKMPSEQRMNAVIHEVCHLLHRGVDRVVGPELTPYLHDYEHDLVKSRYIREIELMVDQLATYVITTSTVRQIWDKYQARQSK